MQKGSPHDPKGLIFEAFRMEGIGAEECRSIFLDWALSLPGEVDQTEAIRTLVAEHGADMSDHPMAQVLKDGLLTMDRPRRRGGWRSRPRN